MTRLIDADAVIESMTKFSNATGEDMTHGIFYAHIAPTIDAEPVRHGKWIWKGEDGDSRFMCSVCQWKEYVPTCNGVPNIWQYCPSCGARMDKDE